MTLAEIHALSRAIARAQRDMNGLHRAIRRLAITAHRADLRQATGTAQLKRRIRAFDWTSIKKDASSQADAYATAIRDVIRLSEARRELLQTRGELTERLRQSFRPVKQTVGWTDTKAQLLVQLTRAGVRKPRRDQIVRQLEAFRFADVLRALKDRETRTTRVVQTSFDKLLKAYVRQVYTRACAVTNLRALSSKQTPIRESQIATLSRRVTQQLTGLKDVIGNGDDRQIAVHGATLDRILTSTLERDLLPLASALYKKQTPNRSAFDTSLERSLLVADAIRHSFLMLAISKRAQFLAANRGVLKDFDVWVKSAAAKPLHHEPLANGVAFSRLARHGSAANRKPLTIQGRVLKVQIRHVRRKPISHLFVTDGVFVVLATLPHVKVDSVGASPGAYVALNGVWYQRETEALGKPSLRMGQIDNATAAEHAWLPWVALAMNDVYEVMPHSLAAAVSWKPGRDGCINPVKYSIL